MRALVYSAFILATSTVASAQSPSPVLFRGGRTDVVIDLPQLRTPEVAQRTMSGVVQSCRAAFNLSSGDSAVFVSSTPPAPELPVGSPKTTLTISLLAVDALQPTCGGNAALGTLAASRGWRISADSAPPADQSVIAAVLRRNGSEVQPVTVQRLQVRRVGQSGIVSSAQTWLRITYSLDAFAFAESGVDSGFVISIETAAGGAPDVVRVPESAVRALWRSLLPLRAEVVTEVTREPVKLDPPTDYWLGRALESYERGERGAAAAQASARLLEASKLSRRDWVFGQVVTGIAFFEAGDASAANVAFSDLVEAEPCFQFDMSVPSDVRGAVSNLPRAQARCHAAGIVPTSLRSAVIPGFGRPMERGRLLARSLVLAAVVGTTVSAYSLNAQAGEKYQEYLDWQNKPVSSSAANPADQLWADAEGLRSAAKTMYAVAAAIYVAQGAWSVMAERRMARELAVVRNVGRAERRASVLPYVNRGAVGAAISIAW